MLLVMVFHQRGEGWGFGAMFRFPAGWMKVRSSYWPA